MKELFFFPLKNFSKFFFRKTELNIQIQQEIYKIPSNQHEHRRTLQKKINKI